MSERHSMRKIREVLRLKYELGLGHRAIAASCAIGKATVCDYLKRADQAALTWLQAQGLTMRRSRAACFDTSVGTSRACGRRSTLAGSTASFVGRG
jgi:transposase